MSPILLASKLLTRYRATYRVTPKGVEWIFPYAPSPFDLSCYRNEFALLEQDGTLRQLEELVLEIKTLDRPMN
jgi:hypothetical protein